MGFPFSRVLLISLIFADFGMIFSHRFSHRCRLEFTMKIYQHVLPVMQEDAAAKMGSILF